MRQPEGSQLSSQPQGTLADSVYQGIFSRIVSGEFQESARLPSEQALADAHRETNAILKAFSVSRPVVRDALSRLREDGLILSRRGSGSYVRQRPDASVLRFTPLTSVADMQRCFEFRVGVEGEAAYHAAARRPAAIVAQLKQAFERLDRVVKTNELGVDADFEFHMAVARATENRFFVDTLQTLRDNITIGMNLARNLSLLSLVQSEHVEILEAIETGRPDDARHAMRAHLEAAKSRVFEG